MIKTVLVVAYSARMLAELAVRANFNVVALDYFGDRDLHDLCPSRSLRRDYADKTYHPAALAAVADSISAEAVVYGAGFENHPSAVQRLSRQHIVLGNTPQTLRQVRDPLQLQSALLEGGFVCPVTRLAPSDQAIEQTAKRWLWKPLKGGGGTHVRWAQPHISMPRTGIWQAYIDGVVGSFAFVANGREARLIGLTEQLIGLPDFGARDFRWCGNLTPPRVSAEDLTAMQREAEALAHYLSQRFGLRGINGVDFVWREGRIWVIEVNPRPSASLELFDMPNGPALFDLHVRACMGESVPAHMPKKQDDIDVAVAPRASADLRADHSPQAVSRGKAILFATQDVLTADTAHWRSHDLRDIPHNHEQIQRGQPICTILAQADSADACLQQLRSKADLVREWLGSASEVK